MTNRYEIDMTSGPLFGKLVFFTLPLVLAGLLQLLFNAADMIVVGRFAENGNTALAAVGATGALISLIVNLFLGLSTGATVLVSRSFGAKNAGAVDRAVHTAVTIAGICGVCVGIFGVCFSETFLRWMATPENVLPDATLYMRIYFCGLPVSMLYNFCSAILRAVGDTRRPLIFLSTAGVVNVLLNLIFVIVFHMDVAGVALATVASQTVSCILVLRCMIVSGGNVSLNLHRLRIHKTELLQIVRVGLPAGIQSSLFAISSVLIQSSINSFGETVMAGNTAASNIDGFIYVAMNMFSQTAINFISQNLGAKKMDRVKRVIFLTCGMVSCVGLVLGSVVYFSGEFLLGIYRPGETEIIAAGMTRMIYFTFPYFLCGLMDVLAGCLRGLGCSLLPMIISMIGACGLRILWIYTVFQLWPTTHMLYISYPITWVITGAVQAVFLMSVFRKIKKQLDAGT